LTAADSIKDVTYLVIRMYVMYKRNTRLTANINLQTATHMLILVPRKCIEEVKNLNWLAATGFGDGECVVKYYRYRYLGATK
jgi:hypothetical protein